MPRGNSIHRTMDGKVKVVINHVQHTLTTPAFIELMADALRVVESIERDKLVEMV